MIWAILAFILVWIPSAVLAYLFWRKCIELDELFINHAEHIRKHRDTINWIIDQIGEAIEYEDEAEEEAAEEPVRTPVVAVSGEVVPNISQNNQDPDGIPLIGHTILVGQTGSGKSNTVMYQLIRRMEAGQILWLIDTKDELCSIFGRHAAACVKPDDGEAILKEALALAEKRRALFNAAAVKYRKPCRDIGEYQVLTGEAMETVCLVIEELIVFRQTVSEEQLIQLLVTGRSAGVFVFAITQQLKANVLDSNGTINFTNRVFMGKWNRYMAQLLFGPIEKEKAILMAKFVGKPGKAIIERSGERVLKNMPRVDPGQLEALMQWEEETE